MNSSSNEPNPREKEIFLAAIEKSNPGERAAYLEGACGDGTVLRQRVEALLARHGEEDSFMRAPAADPLTELTHEIVTEHAGALIDRYKLLQQIGEGGMGVVYMAEQEEPVRRRVALKIIKLGMDTKQVVARFEAERQALALMDHPNIARVLDGGATETGRPYFVMELVQGVPITEFCDKNKLSAKDRLKLFIQVCQAIQSAHQKGIIHRDIKPSNVLVTLHHGDPMPKVIDFGIAKATNQKLTEKTLFTNYATMIGTPAYMSPEQAEMSSMDVDTRTDVYALGVLLYELLTGTTPFPEKRLRSLGYGEMQRVIMEEEPERPSTRLSTMANEQKTAVAKNRGEELTALSKLLKGDLDWVVMKCLEKDRTRRYETANGVAADIHRHLNNEPVVARPPSTAYRLQKMVRRNKLAFAAAAVVTIALIAGLSVAAIAWRQTRIERDSAVKARAGEAAQRLKAEANAQQAREAQTNEAAERAKAQQNLYDSLVREARATRTARRVGYRDEVFNLLKQARSLDVPNKDLSDLRREAIACLGDFVGLTPITFVDFPINTTIRWTRFSPTGHLAAFALSDGTILLRELPSGKVVARLGGERPARSLSFSTAGDQFVSVHAPRSSSDSQGDEERLAESEVYVWTAATDGRWREAEKIVLPGALEPVALGTQWLIAVLDMASHAVNLLDLKTKVVMQRLEFPQEMRRMPEIALSPDGQLVALATDGPVGSDNSVLYVWKNGKYAKRLEPVLTRVQVIRFSSDGRYLACHSDKGCSIYETDGFRSIAELKEYFWEPSAISVLPGSSIVAIPLVQQSRTRLWDWVRNQDIAVLDEPRESMEAAFAADGQSLITTGPRFTRLYQLDHTEKLSLRGQVSAAPTLAFSPDGSQLASVDKDGALKVWDAATGRGAREPYALPGPGQGLSYSQDGQLLATCGFTKLWMHIRNAQTGERLFEFGTNELAVCWAIEFSPNGRFLAMASSGDGPNSGVRVWALNRRETRTSTETLDVRLVKWLPGRFFNLAFTPDGQRLAFASVPPQSRPPFIHTMYVWEFDSTAPPRPLYTGGMMSCQAETFTPGSRYMLMFAPGRTVVTLDLEDGNTVRSFPAVDRRSAVGEFLYGNICLSPHATKLGMTSPSRLGVEVWNPATGRLLYSLPEQNGTVYWLAWSPDGQRLAVPRSNGEIAIWNLPEIERVLAGLGLSP